MEKTKTTANLKSNMDRFIWSNPQRMPFKMYI